MITDATLVEIQTFIRANHWVEDAISAYKRETGNTTVIDTQIEFATWILQHAIDYVFLNGEPGGRQPTGLLSIIEMDDEQ